MPLLLCLLLAPGCGGPKPPPAAPQQPAATQPALAGAASSQPSSAPAPGLVPAGPGKSAVMATVNGRPIYMDALTLPLVETYGPRIAEILVAHALVEQEAERLKITATAAEIEAERAAALDRIFPEDLTADQRQVLLDRLLRERGLTRELWNGTVRQNALLAKMAEPRVLITEAMLKTEFGRLYGEKVEASHIALPDLTEAQKTIQMLRQGEDFAELARKFSTNSVTAKQGGLLPAFSRDEMNIPRAMREAAFSLEVGEVSGIVQVGNTFHVLKLHKRLPPGDVKFEAVREEVFRKVRREIIERLQAEVLSDLRRRAQVEIVNPTLRKAALERQP
jgi:foldase protein PrsA